jgi:uncharacterized protein
MESLTMAQLSSSAINSLPDGDFAYIEPGGKKDDSGKTIPRSLRHFPVHDAAHTRNALARMSQSPFGPKAKSKIMAAARKFGITVSQDGRALDEGAMLPDLERRFVGEDKRAAYMTASAVEVREEPDGNRIAGYASVFQRMSRPLGGFVEEILPSAFGRVQIEGFAGAVCRFNHDPNMLLGTVSGRTLSLNIDRTGLYYDVLPPQSRADILELVKRGDIRHSSFAFRMTADGEEWTVSDQNYPLRRIHEVNELVDVAPVVNPAYPDATAGLRSLAMAKDLDFEEVRMLADANELLKLFVRTDNRAPRVPQPSNKPGLFGPAAAAQLLSRKTDPWGDLG